MTEESRQTHISELIVLALDGEIDQDQLDQLNQKLIRDARARRYYLEFIANEACVVQALATSSPGVELLGACENDDSAFLEVLEKDLHDSAVREAAALQVTEEETGSDVSLFRVSETEKWSVPTRRDVMRIFAKAAAVFLIATGIIWLDRQLWTRFGERSVTPPPQAVAQLVDLVGDWSTEDESYVPGDEMYPATYSLDSGSFAELRVVNGTTLTVEGPARFELIDPKTVFLAEGKLFARVSEEATGFTVNASSSRVIDLGTAFGMQIDRAGTSRVYTYDGEVSFASRDGDTIVDRTIVRAGQARQVHGGNRAISEIPFERQRFVRQVDSQRETVWRGEPLSLANVIDGGDGFGARNKGAIIDPLTGHLVDRVEYTERHGESSYAPVAQNPFVDGVFVPDGGNNVPVTISSTGIVWAGCPNTSNLFYVEVNTQAQMLGSEKMNPLRIRGSSDDAAPLIVLHPNLGITFDLNAIRQALPGMQIREFHSGYGICDYANLVTEEDPAYVADVRILVDGVARCESTGLSAEDGLRQVDIAVKPTDRFLTLVATDGPDHRIRWDWVVFVDPILELQNN